MRQWFTRFALAASALAWVSGSAPAQDYPNRVVTIVVPYLAGGPSDVMSRIVAQHLHEMWKQPVIVENRPGADTIVAAASVANAAPDGYTLLQASDSTLTMNQALYDKLSYDPAKDFAAVTLSSWTPLILVTDAEKGPKSIPELIALAKANPGKVTFGAGNMTTRLAGEMFARVAGIQMQHIPYRGSAGSVRGLLTGDVTLIVDGASPAGLPHIKSGKFRALANLSTQPIAALPGLPAASSYPGLEDYNVLIWNGLVAPAGTPLAIRNKIYQDIAKVYAMPEVREKLLAVGIDTEAKPPQEFADFIAKQRERWTKVIKEAGIKIQ